MDALCCEAGPRFCKGDSETLDPDVRGGGEVYESRRRRSHEGKGTQGNEARIYDVRNGNQTA